MPYNDPDPNDPNVLVGVVLPADAEAMREMAYVFAEEFARMGVDGEHLLSLFKDPFYAGAHGTYRALGEETIQSIIEECIQAWGGIQFSISDFGLPIKGETKIQNPKSKIKNGGREY